MGFLALMFFSKVGFLAHVLKFVKKLEIHKKKIKKKKKQNLEILMVGQSNELGMALRWARVGPYVGQGQC